MRTCVPFLLVVCARIITVLLSEKKVAVSAALLRDADSPAPATSRPELPQSLQVGPIGRGEPPRSGQHAAGGLDLVPEFVAQHEVEPDDFGAGPDDPRLGRVAAPPLVP